MNESQSEIAQRPQWFAIRTAHDVAAAEYLRCRCDEVFFPKERIDVRGKRTTERAVIPRVLFIKTTHDNALDLEEQGRKHPEQAMPFWIFRFPNDDEIQVIPQKSIDLLRLLTADDTTKCRIYTGKEFKERDHVRVIGGIYEGYEGYVQRVQKNKHVIVKIEGVCMIILPFIHPELLKPIDEFNSNK